MNSQPSLSAIVKQFNNLYVMTRAKYLVMNPTGEYFISYTKLHDGIIQKHIEHEQTVGVFAGKYLSKFFNLDVDIEKDLIDAKFLTFRIVNLLMTEYNIPSDYINVSFSGRKGYHVEVFLTDAIPTKTFRRLYKDILIKLDENSSHIQFWPTFHHAVKLPLGKHFGSGNVSWYCDTVTLEQIEDCNHILEIKQMDKDDFLSLINDVLDNPVSTFSLSVPEAQAFEDVVQSTNIDTKPLEDVENEILEIIKLGRLKYPRTRHNTTLNICTLLIGNYGWEVADTIDLVMQILRNTPSDFFSTKTTLEYIEKECHRLANLVSDKNYSITNGAKEIKITKSEVLKILSVRKKHLRKILFCLLVHSKRHHKADGSFYMTYNQLTNMGNAKNRQELLTYIVELEKQGTVEIVSRNEVDKVLTRELKRIMKKPNTYRVRITEEDSEDFIIINEVDVSLLNVIVNLLPMSDVKRLVSRDEFHKEFKPYYQSTDDNKS